MNNNTVEDFENAINIALNQFERRLEQQQLFQVQNNLLKELQKEISSVDFCNSEDIKNLSEQYQSFNTQLKEPGRTYENIVDEKAVVDTYSAFEKFLFDCFCAIYTFFPKFLGSKDKDTNKMKIQLNFDIHDLFIERDIEIIRKNIIELKVKSIIQSGNIKEILEGFEKIFNIKDMKDVISNDDRDHLHEISLIRNLIVHNNSVVNRVHIEKIKQFKILTKYPFNEGDTILKELPSLVENIKEISTKICLNITGIIISDNRRLEESHNRMI